MFLTVCVVFVLSKICFCLSSLSYWSWCQIFSGLNQLPPRFFFIPSPLCVLCNVSVTWVLFNDRCSHTDSDLSAIRIDDSCQCLAPLLTLCCITGSVKSEPLGGREGVIPIDMTFHYLWSSCTTQWFRAGRAAFSQGWLDQFSVHVYTCIQVQWNLLQVVGTKIMSFFHIENKMYLKRTTVLWGKSAAEGYFRHCFEQNCVY